MEGRGCNYISSGSSVANMPVNRAPHQNINEALVQHVMTSTEGTGKLLVLPRKIWARNRLPPWFKPILVDYAGLVSFLALPASNVWKYLIIVKHYLLSFCIFVIFHKIHNFLEFIYYSSFILNDVSDTILCSGLR